MSKYIVTIREVWYQGVEIEADSEEEAFEKVDSGEGKYLMELLGYSYTLEQDTWNIEKVRD